MRVIAGEAKGRPLKAVPGSQTRPTTDKVKEAVFSMIGPFFDGGWALDLFAGTGGLGIEAISRGMERAVFVDLERQSIDIIRKNVAAANMEDRAEIYKNDARRAIKLLEKRNLAFRLVFLDPPYRMKDADAIMDELAVKGLVEPDAIVMVEHESGHHYSEQTGAYIQLKRAVYGEIAVSIYRYQPDDQDTGGA
ncbi:16S rRNA (guanine(966)-N(2))-methyltransferase RsmD [Paenibacillus pinihumi]|uniref:16S rRNA (guanine(966)-N(2))-methyltransferase RsmD n=1 Tax=Paenibacillus pinihumi TaxID=669462 RepID=UPI00040A5682